MLSGNLLVRNSFDSDASRYFQSVAIADGQALEYLVKVAINKFIVGCKQDAVWNAIKASCILAGARTLNGALVPLVGESPTNFNFVQADYDRKLGLKGNGSTKYLDANRNNNADPQNNQHLAVYVMARGTDLAQRYLGAGGGSSGASVLSRAATGGLGAYRSRSSTQFVSNPGAGFPHIVGVSRSNSTQYIGMAVNQIYVVSQNSQTPFNGSITVFQAAGAFANDRLGFYSIGQSLDLPSLSGRLRTLFIDLSSAIA